VIDLLVTQIKRLSLPRPLDLISEKCYVSGKAKKGKKESVILGQWKEVHGMQSQGMSRKGISRQSVNFLIQSLVLDFLVSLFVVNGCCA
jgi:hypothetical protein